MSEAYDDVYQRSLEDPRRFWAIAAQDIEWVRRPRAVIDDSKPPRVRWFPGGMLNSCFNAVDLHVLAGRGDQAALIDLGWSDNWTIKKDAGDCFMHATLEVEKVKRSSDNSIRAWDGRLELPPVKIPMQAEPIDQATIDARIRDLGGKMLSKNGRDSEEAVRALSLIDDPRVIPWYVMALDTDSYSLKFAALDRLSRFNTDEALAGLKKGMATRGTDIGNRRDSDELGEQLASNIRNSAAQALARSPHAEAKRLLLTFWKDPDESVRLNVLHALGRMDSPKSLELIKKMTADKSEMVRGEA
ncbi:MAG: HEAT repeat domain-containing protein, partial [Myxococcales bacterium]|nr:HEAT repeat domain-containing protein [Myxococcales bacterium]